MSEPRSVGEAVAAVDSEREPLAESPSEQAEPVEEEAEEDAEEDAGPDLSEEQNAEPVESVPEHAMADLREALGVPERAEEPVEEIAQDGDSPPTVAPTMDDLRAILTDPAHQPRIPDADLGPLVEYGERRIPLALLRLHQRGWLRDWPT